MVVANEEVVSFIVVEMTVMVSSRNVVVVIGIVVVVFFSLVTVLLAGMGKQTFSRFARFHVCPNFQNFQFALLFMANGQMSKRFHAKRENVFTFSSIYRGQKQTFSR